MLRRITVAALAAGLVLVPSAGAVAPALLTVTVVERHPRATFSAPKADDATIYFATKPDRATDGRFFDENVKHTDSMTDSEIQAGNWLDESQLDPGTYYVVLRASPDFALCYVGSGTYDPSCADGFSNLVTLVVPKPAIRYGASVEILRYIGVAYLELRANPLGERQSYRVCYTSTALARRCLRGTLSGFSWNSSAEDTIRATTRFMPSVTTFSWYVGNRLVARKRVRVPRG